MNNNKYILLGFLFALNAYAMEDKAALARLHQLREKKRVCACALRLAQKNLEDLQQEIIDFNGRQQDISIKREGAKISEKVTRILKGSSLKRGRKLFAPSDENHNPNLIAVLKKVKIGD